MTKIRVLFPYVEAGFGHIMPMKSIDRAFRAKYGDKVEVVSSKFYTETNDSNLIKYEKMISRQVRLYNRAPLIGHLGSLASAVFGVRLSTFACMKLMSPIACKKGIEHMRELKPDIVFSTHWASNYCAEKLSKEEKPYTVMYCPDAQLNELFEYPCDLMLISMPYGYEKALRKKRYNIHNFKMVPFLIRNEAFEIDTDKKRLRKKLGLPEDNFTVVLAEGGYGIGKMDKMTRELLKEKIPLTVIAVCGTTVLGCSTRVQGTGYLINSKVVKNGWPYVSLTEDWEFTADQILYDNKIRYCDEAVFYDEQPTSVKIMWRQRVRWSRGHLLVFYARFGDLFKHLFKKETKHRLSLYDITAYILPSPLFMMILQALQFALMMLAPVFDKSVTLLQIFLGTTNNILFSNGLIYTWTRSTISTYLLMVVMAVTLFITERKRIKGVSLWQKILITIVWPFFLLLQLPIDIQAFCSRHLGWKPIPHDDKTSFEHVNS